MQGEASKLFYRYLPPMTQDQVPPPEVKMNTDIGPAEQPGEEHFLISGRLVPMRRDGNVVYARVLRQGEEDTGEGVTVNAGDKLVIPAGELGINLHDIDEQFNPPRPDGYRPIANTVWTWHQLVRERLGFFLFLFALARRTDAAHTLWASTIEKLKEARAGKGIAQRQEILNSLATAEVTLIALSRCYRMAGGLIRKYCPELHLPESIQSTRETVKEMRDAFEHIDERAAGIIGPGKEHPSALTIFNQPDFIPSSVIRYKSHELDFENQVLAGLIGCRNLIMEAMKARASISNEQKSTATTPSSDI